MAVFTKRIGLSESAHVLDGIQYLRGLCAVIVVISHCNGIIGLPEHYSAMPIPDWHMASLFAVAAFFSISGFIIAIASLDRNCAPRTGPAEYARRRFIRIVPFLWLCIVGYNLLSWAGTGMVEWDLAARTFVLWPIGELKPNVAWSLRHELLFYTMFAVVALGNRPRPAMLLAWLGMSAVFYLVAYDLRFASEVLDRSWFQTLKVLMGGDHGANFQFAFGLGLGYVYLLKRDRLPVGRIPPLAMLVFTAIAGVIVTLWPWEYGLPVSVLWTVLAAPVLASAVCAAPAAGWPGKFGLVLGNASFAIYLVHNPIVLVLLAAAQKGGLVLASEMQLLVFLAFSVMVTVLGGIVAHRLVEVPLIRACERWTARSGQRFARTLPVGDT